MAVPTVVSSFVLSESGSNVARCASRNPFLGGHTITERISSNAWRWICYPTTICIRLVATPYTMYTIYFRGVSAASTALKCTTCPVTCRRFD
ncbi:hypothetical protein K503DRAFT_143140 [Rhizopogon vinicolor AM-OR11-026]|uniref:Uncharacterized protein n=1 Tax=Rhizopogon vinicolor AM-OR11-026 TaxID=1314800 RepID=A0A1B7N1G9_9AGAM|nr:hypothetical protein K503DRAFT_143140 [Rhizopogon vinicolor AM-OR11-026]